MEDTNILLKKMDETTEGSTLVFNDIGVVLNKNRILKGVFGIANPGEILAIMGPSGAGKSTLLNALTCRVPVTSGSITLNGEPVTQKMRRKISYVMQTDVFLPNLTLRETLTFSALMRLPDRMTFDLKMRRLMEITDAFELKKCLNTKMGNGLSGGEKKRASIACELISSPKLLLIDEPTTGLDSATALSLMSSLDKFSKQSSKTILLTIHQPSSEIFHMFKNVLLLAEGQVAYFGNSSKILDFFNGLGLRCAPNYNPADFILKQVKSDSKTVARVLETTITKKNEEFRPLLAATRTYSQSKSVDSISKKEVKYYQSVKSKSKSIDNSKTTDYDHDPQRCRSVINEVNVDAYKDNDAKWQTGFMTQYVALTRRAFTQSKPRYLSPLHLCQVVIILFVALEFFQLERTEETLNDRLGMFYFLVINQGFPIMLNSVPRMFDDYGIFDRERESGIYRLSAYYLAIFTSEFPFTFVMASAFAVPPYWVTNLMPAAANFFAFWAVFVLIGFTTQGYGFFMGSLIKDREFSIEIACTCQAIFLLLGGYYNVHVVHWFYWMRYTSPITIAASALSKVEFTYGDPFTCNPPNRTSFPEFCINGTTINGSEFLTIKRLDFFPLYGDIAALFGFLFAFHVVSFFTILWHSRGPAK